VPITETFKHADYQLSLVESQCAPDPDFSNTLSPNPEEAKAYTQAIELAQSLNADGVLSTDPDADRMGVVVRHQGEYRLLTGNQTGSILIEYLLSTLKESHKLAKNSVIFNTIVTSDLGEKIARHYGVEVEKTLTGFKFIGDKIATYEKTQEKTFVMGYEESYGYLIQAFVRDKDAIQACLILAEAMSYYKHQGQTLVDVLEQLYQTHGYHHEDQVSLSLTGAEGAQRIKTILAYFREQEIKEFAGIKVVVKEDYLTSISTKDGVNTTLNFPSADVIKYLLEDGSWLAIRPSGTEPKCKFYFCVLGSSQKEAQSKFKELKQALQDHYE
jgi:phosphoglucomutase